MLVPPASFMDVQSKQVIRVVGNPARRLTTHTSQDTGLDDELLGTNILQDVYALTHGRPLSA